LEVGQTWGGCELVEEEIPSFLELWNLLEKNSEYFDFSLRRFNLSFDRRNLDDRIVDLIISAESVFLGEIDPADRGELRFRLALRAAKFIQHPTYGEKEVFEVMRRAYDVRSAIVHRGKPAKTCLPNNPSANLQTFIEAIEELMRLALRKALSMKENGKNLDKAEFWVDLIFSKP